MTRKEVLFRELCLEVIRGGIQTDRFTELWLETGVRLEGFELELANRFLSHQEGTTTVWKSVTPLLH